MTLRPLFLALPLAALAAPAPAAETVSLPAFRSIQLRGGGDVVIRRGPVQRVTLTEGSTAYTSFQVVRDGQLRINACNDRCPQRYDLTILIETPALPDMAVMGGGRISADGSFPPQTDISAAVDGGGQIDTRSVRAREVSAAVNGGGQILVSADRSLNAAVNGGGQIRYRGNPSVSSAVQGGGDVRQER